MQIDFKSIAPYHRPISGTATLFYRMLSPLLDHFYTDSWIQRVFVHLFSWLISTIFFIISNSFNSNYTILRLYCKFVDRRWYPWQLQPFRLTFQIEMWKLDVLGRIGQDRWVGNSKEAGGGGGGGEGWEGWEWDGKGEGMSKEWKKRSHINV